MVLDKLRSLHEVVFMVDFWVIWFTKGNGLAEIKIGRGWRWVEAGNGKSKIKFQIPSLSGI